MSLRSVLQQFAHFTGHAFRILPRKRRFAVAQRIALLIAPVVRRSSYFPRRPSLLDGPREETLRMLLRSMTRARVEFVPDVEVRGYEHVAGRPVLIVTGHFLLNITMSRLIMDSGRRMFFSLAGPREPMYYHGTIVPLDVLYASPYLLFQLSQTLADGHVGSLAVEAEDPHDDWIVVETVAGPRYVSPAIFTFASRTGMPLVFGATYLNRERRLTVTYEVPREKDGAELTAEFCRFLQKHAAAVVR